MSNLYNDDEVRFIKYENTEQFIYIRSQLLIEPESRILLVTRKIVNKKTGKVRLKTLLREVL
jgi:hypothetical protein